MFRIDWYQNEWPWPLVRGRLKSREPLRHIRHWISTMWVQKIPPCGFLTFFPNGWEFLINFYTTIARYCQRWITKFYSIISNFDEVMPYYARSPINFFTFHYNWTSELKFVYWANDVTVDGMSYPENSRSGMTCHRQRSTNLSYQRLSQRLHACVSADGGHFAHIMWTR